jgi:hypothetical protein
MPWMSEAWRASLPHRGKRWRCGKSPADQGLRLNSGGGQCTTTTRVSLRMATALSHARPGSCRADHFVVFAEIDLLHALWVFLPAGTARARPAMHCLGAWWVREQLVVQRAGAC